MKFLLVILPSVLAFAIAAPNTSTDLTSTEEKIFDNFMEWSHGDFNKYIQKFVENKKREVCENEGFDLQTPFAESVKRIEEVSKEDLSSLTVCTIVKTKLLYVTEPLVKAIDNDCLPKEMSGLADYVVRTVLASVSQICALSGEEILELINPCFSKINFADGHCFETLSEPPKFGDTPYVRGTFQQEVCRGYTEIRPCLKQGIEEKCQLRITQQTAMTFLDGVLQKPCST